MSKKPTKRQVVARWEGDQLWAEDYSVECCTTPDGTALVGVNFHAGNGATFAHTHFTADAARDMARQLLEAAENTEMRSGERSIN